jgi:peptide/nickel transport system substrate-binding protein
MTRNKWAFAVLALGALAIMGALWVADNSGSMFVTPTLVPTLQRPTSSPTSPTVIPTDVPTPLPPKELTICQAEEPNTLFIYGGPSRAARNVLEAIYDGPIDTRSYQFQPVILEKIPSLTDGDAAVYTVEIGEGSQVVDVNGLAVNLLAGVTVFNADGQQVTFEGEAGEVITMSQMVVTFTLRAGLTWADGEPLTAYDSRYSYQLAGEFDNPSLQLLWERTKRYDVLDDRTVVWTGLPGYRDPFYFMNFYHPLPQHAWGQVTADFLLNAEVAQRKPLGWGPFSVEEWVAGDHITLVRNPHYFRAAEGLPYLDRVTFRFVRDLRQALDWLAGGECDLITQDVIEGGDVEPLLTAVQNGQAQLISSPSSEWEHLDFGIQPASWVRRPDYFGDVRVRQAIAQCVDRERIAREAPLYGKASVAASYIAPEHPLYMNDRLHHWGYDPAGGRLLLDEVGWRDEDGDGMREAHNVAGVAYGTPFTVTLLTTSDYTPHERTARILTENLAECGIGLAVEVLPPEEFFADGPDGPVFGRQFDLALFSWQNYLDAPCGLYLSAQIPGPDNWWATSNNPGYSSAEYDAACQAALNALPGTDDYARFYGEAQRIFSNDLPVLPLYFVPKAVAVRPGVSGVVLDPGEFLELWNIESFDK